MRRAWEQREPTYARSVAQSSQHSSRMEVLRGKVVVITGASSGLGRATALRFAAAAALVVASARRQSALEETVRLCQELGGRAHHFVADVTAEEDVLQLAAFAHAQCGGIF